MEAMESENVRKLREARAALGKFPVPPVIREALEGLVAVLEDQEARLTRVEWAELDREG